MQHTSFGHDGPSIIIPMSSEIEEFRRLLRSGPIDLIAIRHGFSEANFAQKEFKRDSNSEIAQRMSKVPDTEVRLLAKCAPHSGIEQASAAGKWLHEALGFVPSIGYTSDFARAQETAALIGTTAGYEGQWRLDPLIGERSWGRLHQLSPDEQYRELTLRDEQVRHWTPAHGESIKAVEAYVRDFLNSIWRKHPGERVLLVTHGEFILALQSVLEKFTPEQLHASGDRGFPNCGILHYSRRDPNNSLLLSESLDHVRKICPWDTNWKGENWSGIWQKVTRPSFSSAELLLRAEKFSRQIVAP